MESKCNDSEGEQVKLKTNSLDVAGKAWGQTKGKPGQSEFSGEMMLLLP